MDFCLLLKMWLKILVKLLDHAKESDALKIASKSENQKTAEATGNLIGSKITDRNTESQKLHQRII